MGRSMNRLWLQPRRWLPVTKPVGEELKMNELRTRLESYMSRFSQEDICLAFSGGVDSSLLLKAALDAVKDSGHRVHAVTFSTRLHPPCDLEAARKIAGELGGIHVILEVDELEQKEIAKNPVDRCYLCKRQLFTRLSAYAAGMGIRHILDGTNWDDLHVYRPGIRALRELGIISPLAELHMTKDQVRSLAAEYGISAASRPSTPCMATRLPYGAKLDYDLLERIETGEMWLRDQLGGNVRLRIHGEVARIEVDATSMEKLLRLGSQAAERLKALGFHYVTLDLEGFRSGSMDQYIDRSEGGNLHDHCRSEQKI